MPKSERGEMLGAWLVAALALAVLGMVPEMAAREAATPARAQAATPPRTATAGAPDALPLRYDAADFADWLATRSAAPASGPADADS